MPSTNFKKGKQNLGFISIESSYAMTLLIFGGVNLDFHFVLLACARVDREACSSTPILKEQASQLVLSIANFINNCAAEQIHLAPDKCMHLYFTSNCI